MKKRRFLIAWLCLLLLGTGAGLQAQTSPEQGTTAISSSGQNSRNWLTGEWYGIGFQVTGSVWSMHFTADMKKETYLIEYPSLDCGGSWEITEKDRDRLVMVEHITDGPDKCVDFGTVIVTRVDDSHISFSWFMPQSGELLAYATLTRDAKPIGYDRFEGKKI